MSRVEEARLRKLMVDAQAGDRNAYRVLLRHVEKMALAYLTVRVSLQEDRNDLVQEILVSVHKARHSYDADLPLYPWLYAIFSFRLQDYLRRYYRLSHRETTEDADLLADEIGQTPQEQVEHKQLSEKLLSYLSQTQRSIIDMVYGQGYSAAEVAKKHQLSEANIRTTSYRTLRKLREIAKKEGIEW